MKHAVCKYDELNPSEMKEVTIDRTSIVVIRTRDGEVYALRNVCPHKGPALSFGTLDGICTVNDCGEYKLERDGEILKCPWHSWEFDIKTGRSLFDPERVRVGTYGVTVEDGIVLVHK